MIRRVFLAAAAMLVLLIGQPSRALADQPIPADARIAPDAAVKYGTLSNGLRYAIMRNEAPSGAVSIRLAMHVGSYDEGDDERGFAHFIEHLAFRSTRQSPDGALDNRFAALGVALGRDQNAVTGLESTIYRIDIPGGGSGGVQAVLDWMRGAADGILFTKAAVDLERGVVLAELHARENPQSALQRQIAEFQGPGLRSSAREPGGTQVSLEAATADRLQSFYQRWYRPENGMVVIVGDAPVEELERAAEKAFGSWTGTGAAGTRWRPSETAAPRAIDAFTKSDPALASLVTACRIAPLSQDRSPTLQRMRREAYSQIWTQVLANRLTHAAAGAGSPLLSAGALVSNEMPDARSTCLIVLPTGDRWQQALGVAQAELRRLAQDGPSAQEVETAVEQLRSALRGSAYQSGTRVTPMLADQIADAWLDGRVFAHPKEAMRAFDVAVAGVTADDLKKAIANDWSGNGPLLSASAPSAPPREALIAAWRAGDEAAPLAAYAGPRTAEWVYYDFGAAGNVKKREIFPDPGFVRLRFKNGVVVNFKQTSLQSGGVEVRIRFGHGERGLDRASRVPAALAASVFPMGGLGRMDFEQIGLALNNTTWMFNLDVEATGYVLSTSTLSDQLPQQMRVLAAYMTDAAFGPMIDEKLPTVIDLVYRGYRSDPNNVAAEATERALFPDQLSLPPRDQLIRYRAADFARVLRPALSRAPIEITVVGDVREEEVVRSVALTFGALPPRPPLAPPPGEGPFRHYPEILPPPLTAFHEGPSDKAAAVLTWPLYTANPQRRREEYAIGLLTQIFQNRLIRQVRGAMGKAYSPTVINIMVDEADQGFLAAQLEATPGDIDALVSAARALAAELAQGKISQAELEAAREPLIAARLQAQSRNEAWAGILSHSVRNPEAIFELTRFQADLAALTLEDVRKAAATWLARDPVIARALPAARTAGQPNPAPAGTGG